MWFLPRSFSHLGLPPVSINNIDLQRVTVQKYLGVTIDDKLDWSTQVSNVCKKMSYYLFWINSKRKSLTPQVIKMLVDSLVLSHLQHALPVWDPPLPQGSINRLQKLQNWGVRIAQSLRKYDHVSHHLKLLSWLPITQVDSVQIELCYVSSLY